METRTRLDRGSWLLAVRPLHVAIAVLLLYSALVINRLREHDWDATAFIVAGEKYVDQARLVVPITVLPGSDGYDGVFYYRLGLDPFTTDITAFGIRLDNPATRMQRIGYPVLAWAVSFGQPLLLPWALIGLNLTGLFAIGWISAALARRYGHSAWVGIMPALYPGFVLTLSRDTTEIFATTFALAALSFALKREYWRAAPFASCAVMTRETTLLYLAGFGLAEVAACVQRRRWSWALLALMIPAGVFVVWQLVIIHIWGASSYTGTAQNLGAPLQGLVGFFTTDVTALWHDSRYSYDMKLHGYYAVAAAMCVAVCILGSIEVVTGRANVGLKMSWVLYLLLVICLTTAIWIQPYDFLRAFSDCFVVGATLVMVSGGRWLQLAFLAPIPPVWILTALYARL